MATDDRYRRGDYRVVAARLMPAAVDLVSRSGVRDGTVLDVAAGTGNVSVAASRTGARVVALDVSAPQVALGRHRTAEDAPDVSWVIGDGAALPFGDGAFGAALSTFGVMYAGDPARAVDEMARVTRRGGRLGTTSWPVGGYQHLVNDAIVELIGPEAGSKVHPVWYRAGTVADLLAGVGDDVEVVAGETSARYDSVESYWAEASTTAGPLVALMESQDDTTMGELAERIKAAAMETGRVDENGFLLVNTYLLAVATVR